MLRSGCLDLHGVNSNFLKNLAFDLLIHVSFNYFPFFMTFIQHSIVVKLKMHKEFFLIYLKLSKEYGLKDSSIKCNVLVQQVNLSSFNEAFSKQIPASFIKWPVFTMGTSTCWCTIKFNNLFFLIYINDLSRVFHQQPTF